MTATDKASLEFTRRFEGGGYSLSLDDLREIATLLETEVGPQGQYDTSTRFTIRGKEHDFSCRLAADLQQVNVPLTISRASFRLRSDKGLMDFEIGSQHGPPYLFGEPVSIQVTGSDRDWVPGAFDRVMQRLASCRTPWSWLRGSLWYVVALCTLYALFAFLAVRFIPKGHAVLDGISFFLLGWVDKWTIDFVFTVYPDVEVKSPRSRNLAAYRIGIWAIILGVVAAAIWQGVLLSLGH